MSEVYDNDSGQIARAAYKVFTTDMGGGQTALEEAIASMNARLTAEGEPYTLPITPVSVKYGLGGARLVNPEDCPEIRILVSGWQIKGEPSGLGRQGFDNHTFQVVSYLSHSEAAGDLDAESVLALQALDWEKVLVHAVRRRPNFGIWTYGQGSIGAVRRPTARFESANTTLKGEARCCKITQTWRIGQDARH